MFITVSTFIKKDWQAAFLAVRRAGIAGLLLLFVPHVFYANQTPEFFVGAGGQLYLPSLSLQTDFTPWFGGGGYFEGGFELKDFQADCSAAFAQFSGRKRLAGMGGAELALGASYLIRKKHSARLPAWLNLRPHLSVFVNFYSAEFHKSSGNFGENPILFDNGITAGFTPGFFVDFSNIFSIRGQKIVPTVGLEQSFCFDKKGGLFTAPVFSAGVRVFPKCPPKPKAIDSVSEPAEFTLPPPELEIELPEVQEEEEIASPIEAEETLVEVDEAREEDVHSEEAEMQEEDDMPIIAEPEPEIASLPPEPPQEVLNIPFILFSPNVSSLAALAAPEKHAVADALDEIVRILNAHPDFELNILGYAHNVSGTDGENEQELLPLSRLRAESIRKELEKRGIANERMHSRAMGAGVSPLPNGWKNRRVEFELIKIH